jgi:serine O-acetyltransferase
VCYLGANATIIGPLVLGNNISIGASACVVKSYLEDNIILIGVPAIPKSKK